MRLSELWMWTLAIVIAFCWLTVHFVASALAVGVFLGIVAWIVKWFLTF